MTRTNVEAQPGINQMAQDSVAKQPVRHTDNSKLENRKRRRRLDLRTVDGTLRESARVYRELAEGRITQGEADTRSRILGRHAGILEQRYLESLDQQLRERNALMNQARSVIDANPLPAIPGSTDDV